ncbi:MAG: hypothetical protein Q8T08_20535 [Ignavibacteria bacterium]|nr:hypothetical protein [Ignavibacteria bacterium]
MNVLADKGYQTGDQLQCVLAYITTYVSPKAPSTKDICLDPIYAFKYNPESDTYTYPAGEVLTTNNVWNRHSLAQRERLLLFVLNVICPQKCSSCSQRNLCTNISRNGRAIDKSEFADIIAQNATRVNETPNYYRLRQQIAEYPWGTLKRQVLGEVSLTIIGYNLMRSVQIMTPRKFIELLIINSFLPKTPLNPIFSPPIYSDLPDKHKMAS